MPQRSFLRPSYPHGLLRKQIDRKLFPRNPGKSRPGSMEPRRGGPTTRIFSARRSASGTGDGICLGQRLGTRRPVSGLLAQPEECRRHDCPRKRGSNPALEKGARICLRAEQAILLPRGALSSRRHRSSRRLNPPRRPLLRYCRAGRMSRAMVSSRCAL